MKILAIDTSTRHLSLALADDDVVLAERNVRPRKDLALFLTVDIERILMRTGLTLDGIDGFVIGMGPGSFTGLRVGFSTVKALAMVTGKPVVGVGSLDAIARNVRLKIPAKICVITDARRGLLYSAVYEKGIDELVRKSEYQLKPVDDILLSLTGAVIFTGDGVAVYREYIVEKAGASGGRFSVFFEAERYWKPRARHLVCAGHKKLLGGDFQSAEALLPLYLYPEDCQVGQKKAS